jgi:putative membrane protein
MGITDHLANKRTFLAWVRTGIALMGFGFVISKFEIFIHILNRSSYNNIGNSLIAGEIMIILGIVTIGYGLYEFLSNEKDIENNNVNSRKFESIVFSAIIIGMAILLLVFIV